MSRRSRGGVFGFIGRSCVGSWAGQASRALSGGEAECVEVTSGAARGIFAKSLLKETGATMNVTVEADSSAAMGIFSRFAVGRIRDLGARCPWLEEKTADGEVSTRKIGTQGTWQTL